MRIKLLLIITTILNTLLVAQNINISLFKSEYMVFEPIICHIEIINNTGNPLIIQNLYRNQGHKRCGTYPIMKRNNEDAKIQDRFIASEWGDGYSMAPSDTLTALCDLTFNYINGSYKLSNGFGKFCLTPGDYSMAFEFTNEINGKKVITISNEVTFKIIAPDLAEEEVVTQAFRNYTNIQILLDLIRNNPKSRYKTFLEERIVSNYRYGPKQSKRLLKDYLLKNSSRDLIYYFGTYFMSDLIELKKDINFMQMLKIIEIDHFTNREEKIYNKKNRCYKNTGTRKRMLEK